MEIPLQFERCVICCQAPADSLEHILPAALGGRLKARILCTRCNNYLGQSLVSTVKTDPMIRLAIEYLSPELPDLFQENLTYTGTTSEGIKIRVKKKKGSRKVVSDSVQGILIQDTGDALKTLRKKLTKSGMPLSEVYKWGYAFEELDENQPLRTPNGEIFIKKTLPELHPELSVRMMDDRLLVLIAYEFLTVAVGMSIYHPVFDRIRDYIQGGQKNSQIIITHLAGATTYDAVHDLIIEPLDHGVRVLIGLFHWITYEVRFEGFIYGGPDAVYIEDLKTADSLIALSREDARNGRWLVP